jgi:hypothetical protein
MKSSYRLRKDDQVPTRRDWTPNMEQRADLEGRQVKCLIASEGHLWMRAFFDGLPPAVRRRLADSPFNICPACMVAEARRVTARPTVATYFRRDRGDRAKTEQQQLTTVTVTAQQERIIT